MSALLRKADIAELLPEFASRPHHQQPFIAVRNQQFESSQLADAVTCEPISALTFPANREKNREFRRIRALSAILKADT